VSTFGPVETISLHASKGSELWFSGDDHDLQVIAADFFPVCDFAPDKSGSTGRCSGSDFVVRMDNRNNSIDRNNGGNGIHTL